MTIIDEEEKKQQNNKHQRDTASSGAQQQQDRSANRGGLGGMINNIRRPLSRNLSEVVNNFTKISQKVLESGIPTASDVGDWVMVPLDANRYKLHYSAAILVGTFDFGGKRTAVVHTMILGASASDPRSESITMQGQSAEIIRSPMDAWDGDTWADAQTAVMERIGDGIDILSAGAMVIPDTMDLTDEDRIFNVIRSASQAVMSIVESEYPDNYNQVNIAAHFDSKIERLTAQFIYNGAVSQNVVGLPIRSDIAIALNLSDRNAAPQGQISNFQHEGSTDIVSVHAFTDLIYVQPAPATPGVQPDMRHYVPRVVITAIDGRDAPLTPEILLLGLATARLAGDNFAWAGVFNNYSDENHDIGAIGYRMKNPLDPNIQSVRIDTKTNTFGQAELFDLIQSTCHKDPVFSIDCEDVGTDSWLTSGLMAAANGDPGATQYWIKAASEVTGGNFERFFPENAQVAVSENSRVHLGTYTDSNGETKDLRDIDYLTMLNLLGSGDLNAVLDWEATFNDMSTPSELRLDRRLQLLRSVVPSNLRIRGFATRVTITPEFMGALVEGLIAAGLTVDTDGLQTMFGANAQVGNTVIGNYAVHSGNANGMISPASGPAGGPGVWRPSSRMGNW